VQPAEPDVSFLEKRNPRATPRSTIRAACWGGICFFVFTLAFLSYIGFTNPLPSGGFFADFATFMLVFMTVVGAITGAAMHWQQPC
jgi:hypothetical protein